MVKNFLTLNLFNPIKIITDINIKIKYLISIFPE